MLMHLKEYSKSMLTNELDLQLSKEIKYTNKSYPSIIPMVSITQITECMKYIKHIKKNEIIKFIIGKTEENDKKENDTSDNTDVMDIETQQRRGRKRKLSELNMSVDHSNKNKSQQSSIESFLIPNSKGMCYIL